MGKGEWCLVMAMSRICIDRLLQQPIRMHGHADFWPGMREMSWSNSFQSLSKQHTSILIKTPDLGSPFPSFTPIFHAGAGRRLPRVLDHCSVLLPGSSPWLLQRTTPSTLQCPRRPHHPSIASPFHPSSRPPRASSHGSTPPSLSSRPSSS